jgi:protocatechuate 3,4-dioxygenase alpha subunit
VQGKDIDKGLTPSQTVGPFFKYGLTPGGQYAWNDAFTGDMITPDATGERIRVEGRVFDGDGQPVPDCMLEVWQADAQGRFADPQDKRALPNTKFCAICIRGSISATRKPMPVIPCWRWCPKIAARR